MSSKEKNEIASGRATVNPGRGRCSSAATCCAAKAEYLNHASIERSAATANPRSARGRVARESASPTHHAKTVAPKMSAT